MPLYNITIFQRYSIYTEACQTRHRVWGYDDVTMRPYKWPALKEPLLAMSFAVDRGLSVTIVCLLIQDSYADLL